MSKTAYITTPIYYPSGRPHVGTAYTSIACDVYARFKRLAGFDTMFLTGTDEHGLKLQRRAEENGMDTQSYVDSMVPFFDDLSEACHLSNDDFIRTTQERHKKTVTHMWNRLQEEGYIYKDTYAGWYCVSDEAYYTEDELVEGKAPSGHPVEWMEEESYFFKLSAFEEKLLELYENNPDFILPKSRKNEIVSFVKGGLEDISISRTTFDWGVPVPGDDKHVMYVWIDALTNYLSALDWPNGEKMKYWPAVHMVGKDIIRFHAVYWPAMLMGAGVELPKHIVAHGWWTVEGKKMSKSFGNVIDPVELAEAVGVDQMRYFLLREVTFGADGDFSHDRLISRVNSELANELGNLFQRVLSMVAKNCDGKVPAVGELSEADKEWIATCESMGEKLAPHIDGFAFHKYLETLWQMVTAANQYMDAMKPWELKKQDPARMAHVLRVLMEGFKYIALYIEPVCPVAAKRFQHVIGFENKAFSDLEGEFFALPEGMELPKPEGVFPRLEKEEAA